MPALGSLGRHAEWDDANLAYLVPRRNVEVKSVLWERRSPILDQGDVGACTGFSAADWLATDNAKRHGASSIMNEDGLRLYAQATHLDGIAGVYPPDDTGSSGLAACRALVKHKDATAYHHALGLQHALEALQAGPALTGIQWRTGCDTPDSKGRVKWSGTVRGGHELLLSGYDHDLGMVQLTNHWSASWSTGGVCWMSCEDYEAALAAQGDVQQPS